MIKCPLEWPSRGENVMQCHIGCCFTINTWWLSARWCPITCGWCHILCGWCPIACSRCPFSFSAPPPLDSLSLPLDEYIDNNVIGVRGHSGTRCLAPGQLSRGWDDFLLWWMAVTMATESWYGDVTRQWDSYWRASSLILHISPRWSRGHCFLQALSVYVYVCVLLCACVCVLASI